jgi:phytoene dehydrogenase-like protein
VAFTTGNPQVVAETRNATNPGTRVANLTRVGETRVVIIGGGLAGLSAGCYARANGFAVTIVEHNLALGGVCTAWRRGAYLVDGCIHWLTGGPFSRLYEELAILPRVKVRPLQEFCTYRHARDGWAVTLTADLERSENALRAIAPEDAAEIARLIEAARTVAELTPPVDRPPELASLRDQLWDLWHLRHEIGTLAHFRQSLAAWLPEHLKNARLRQFLGRLLPGETPALFLLMVLGYLERGWLSRPVGGTASFRDALIDRYGALGGDAVLNTTAEEVLVSDGRARGVRLTDGTMIEADVVISTSSAPETIFRLLAGRFGAEDWRTRMDTWRMFQPIVLASYGVAQPLTGEPAMLLIDGIDPCTLGDYPNDYLYLRIYNDDPAFAPPGHAVVQAMLQTQYDWWAKTSTRYQHEKDVAADRVLGCLDQHLPGVKAAARMVDVATPLTFWRNARAWRGAFEGWLPQSAFTHLPKQLAGLDRFYLAGQWVEPGGGVPVAIMSGRHVVEILCAHLRRPFVSERSAHLPAINR